MVYLHKYPSHLYFDNVQYFHIYEIIDQILTNFYRFLLKIYDHA